MLNKVEPNATSVHIAYNSRTFNSFCKAALQLQAFMSPWGCGPDVMKLQRAIQKNGCPKKTNTAVIAIIILIHWGPVTHICVSKLTIIGSDIGLSPGRRQATIWTTAWMFIIVPNKVQWNLNQNSYIFFQENAFENVVLKMASIFKYGLGLNVSGMYTACITWNWHSVLVIVAHYFCSPVPKSISVVEITLWRNNT